MKYDWLDEWVVRVFDNDNCKCEIGKVYRFFRVSCWNITQVIQDDGETLGSEVDNTIWRKATHKEVYQSYALHGATDVTFGGVPHSFYTTDMHKLAFPEFYNVPTATTDAYEQCITMHSTHVKCIKKLDACDVGHVEAVKDSIKYCTSSWAACNASGELVVNKPADNVAPTIAIREAAPPFPKGVDVTVVAKDASTLHLHCNSGSFEFGTRVVDGERKIHNYMFGKELCSESIRVEDYITEELQRRFHDNAPIDDIFDSMKHAQGECTPPNILEAANNVVGMCSSTTKELREWKGSMNLEDCKRSVNSAENLRWTNRNTNNLNNGETKMLKIKTNVTQIDGKNADTFDKDYFIFLIKCENEAIKELNDAGVKSKYIAKRVKKHNANIAKLIKLLDS